MSKRSQFILTTLTLVLITIPYLVAASAGDGSVVFNGLLLNPLDGNSYLAKMFMGWSGKWLFTLPFFSGESQPSFLFIFYLFLGHLARWTGLSLLMVFHGVRILSSLALCLVMASFIRTFFSKFSPVAQTFTFALLCLGSGLGWLAAFFGGFTSDFWVAEAYPFLSMYSNPHFPLGLALLLWYFLQLNGHYSSRKPILLLLAGISMALIQPFAVVIGTIVTAGLHLWEWVSGDRRIRWWSLTFLLPGLAIIAYQYIVVQFDPLLAEWNAQNLTITPPIWDVLIAFSPTIFGAVLLIASLGRLKDLHSFKLIIVWMIIGLLLAYFPVGLQRRFLLGYFIPIACLAGIAIGELLAVPGKWKLAIVTSFATVSIITNLLILTGGFAAIATLDRSIFYPEEVDNAMIWIEETARPGSLIMASSETGLLLPGRTESRVMYGHPYETPDASLRKLEVDLFFSNKMNASSIKKYIEKNSINYVFVGPFEMENGFDNSLMQKYPIAYKNDMVTIFQVDELQ